VDLRTGASAETSGVRHVPAYNEADTIGWLLDALARQDIGRKRLEVVVADGMSDDATRQVVRQVAEAWRDLSIRIVDNPPRTIPAALNRAIEAARGAIVVRLDAHSIPAEDYVRRCVETLAETGAANVGGVWEIQPRGTGWIPKAIARAAAHPLGAGDARYRIRGRPGPVDTVPFGAFQRDWVRRIGGFDETLLTNEDYEFNYRLRQAGGTVWFDPGIWSTYYARKSLAELWRQYTRYGYWKARMLVLHPRSLRWRQALPALFVLTSVLGLAAAPWWPPALGAGARMGRLCPGPVGRGGCRSFPKRVALDDRRSSCFVGDDAPRVGRLVLGRSSRRRRTIETFARDSMSRASWRLRAGERRWLLLAGDLLAAGVATYLALQLWSRLDYLGNETLATFVRVRSPWFPLLPLLWPFLMVELYDIHRAASWRHTLRGLLLAAAAGGVLYLIVYFSSGTGSLPRRGFLYFLALATLLTLCWRALYIRVFTAPGMMRRVAIVTGRGRLC
jgi:GT2 family glycosyltransferase